ncbi:MAG: hypothetical protein V4793_03435 [Paraburkholderia tropica]|uniref:hypothetical protein n=1 Tax=Paraburkholderia tropica TaxID=92647 RepID=UPI003100FD0C
MRRDQRAGDQQTDAQAGRGDTGRTFLLEQGNIVRIESGFIPIPLASTSSTTASSRTLMRSWMWPPFYAGTALAILGGSAITFFLLDPVKALYWSAAINGLAALPIMVVVTLMGGIVR